MTLDDQYILKCIQAKVPLKQIAEKLGMSLEELQKRHHQILIELDAANSSGYYALSEQFNILCLQYQMVGESLKLVASALGNVMPDNELEKLITANPKETVSNLRKAAIVLRPYQYQDPVKSLDESLKKTRLSN